MRTSVQLVMLSAPEPEACARFYEDLGLALVEVRGTDVVVEGHGVQLVISRGAGQGHREPPDRRGVLFEITVSMGRMEALWEHDRARGAGRVGPVLEARGTFAYVTVDPAGNAVALVSPLPDVGATPPARVTKRIRRPGF